MAVKRRVRRSRKSKKTSGKAIALALVVFSAFTLLSVLRPDNSGAVGRLVNTAMFRFFGDMGLGMALGLGAASLLFLVKGPQSLRAGISLLVLCLTLVVGRHLAIPAIRRETLRIWDGVGGGAFGWLLAGAISGLFGTIGAFMLLGVISCLSFMGVTSWGLQDVWKRVQWLGSALVALSSKLKTPPPLEEDLDDEEIFTPREILPPAHQEHLQEIMTELEPEVEVATAAGRADEAEAVIEAKEWKVEQLPLPAVPYTLPSLSMLNRGLRPGGSRGSREEKENIRILEDTLSNFGVRAKVVEVTRGPTYTRYEIQTAPGTKVSKVTSLSNDLAMCLASEGVRIEAPIPGKAAIGIEVPNKARTAVTLRDVLESREFQNSSSALSVALGKDIEGNTVVTDLSQMPHLLIAGATGAGKSVCINTLICSILYKSTPDQVKFMLIDPKVVELSVYNGIPHLIAPVLNHPKKAAMALKWATQEMEKRYSLFAKAGVRDIERYNETMLEKGQERIPQMVIIIDELADLMMVAKAEVEDAICRLAQMARAAGMHLVVGTQRPSTDVITGLIKANIPSRLSFTVSSSTDSRVILDVSGAEKLLGRGDMLFLPVGWSKPRRIQGAYVSNREIENIVDHVATQGEAQYIQILNIQEDFDAAGSDGELDERFDEAVRVVAEAGQASVSMLQRRMKLGYTRAARIVDQMFDQGIVGPSEGSKPRQVNKNKDIVKAILESKQGS